MVYTILKHSRQSFQLQTTQYYKIGTYIQVETKRNVLLLIIPIITRKISKKKYYLGKKLLPALISTEMKYMEFLN